MNYTYENTKGIDTDIQEIQTYLHEQLQWGSVNSYGRVFKNNLKGKKAIVPEAYIGKGEYKDVLTDDKVNALFFFVEDEEHKSKEGYLFKTKINIVVIANLKKIFDNSKYREDNQCEDSVISILQGKGIQVLKIKKGVKAALGEFYNENISLSNMEPYHCFSLEFDLSYYLEC